MTGVYHFTGLKHYLDFVCISVILELSITLKHVCKSGFLI